VASQAGSVWVLHMVVGLEGSKEWHFVWVVCMAVTDDCMVWAGGYICT